MNLRELLGRKFAGMNAFHLPGVNRPIAKIGPTVLSQAITTYRPKSFSISTSALGGRGNGATSRVMMVGWEARWRVPLCGGTEFRLCKRDVSDFVT